MQKILKTFDYKNLLIKEYNNWYLLLRKEQVTLGSLVLIEKSFRTRYSEIPNESFDEFGIIVKEIEFVLKTLFDYDKVNYFMLMMVDEEVHYHVIPRYSKDIEFSEVKFIDKGWPVLPDFRYKNRINDIEIENLLKLIKSELENK
ncbi:HIT family protein [bacterium]|jgi:diadenosine tetraphosphate (Ap4A) HIT family hydrolase|nr:HIT family protein [bacterium]